MLQIFSESVAHNFFFFWGRYIPLELAILKVSKSLVRGGWGVGGGLGVGAMGNWAQTFGSKTQNSALQVFLRPKISTMSKCFMCFWWNSISSKWVFLWNSIVRNLLLIWKNYIEIKNLVFISSKILLKFKNNFRDKNWSGFEPLILAFVSHARIWNLFSSLLYLV